MRRQTLLLLVATLSLASIVYFFWQADEDVAEEKIADRRQAKKRALILYHFHPCGRNVTTNVGLFFHDVLYPPAKPASFSGVDYIFVYGSAAAHAVRVVHELRNTRVVETPILPADLAAFGAVAEHWWDAEAWSLKYGRIIWLNAGTIGPFYESAPLTPSVSWVDTVSGAIHGITDPARTVISATVSWELGLHPQSNFMSCPVGAAMLLLRGLYRAKYRSKGELIEMAEVGAGAALLRANYSLFELTRRIFVDASSPALNKKNTFMEIEPNVTVAVFCKLNDAGFRSMARSVKFAASQERRRLGLDDEHVSELMARVLGMPSKPLLLKRLCTSLPSRRSTK